MVCWIRLWIYILKADYMIHINDTLTSEIYWLTKFLWIFPVSESRRNQTDQLHVGTKKVKKIDDVWPYLKS